MKLNVAYPATGCQKIVEIDDERKLRIFYEKRISQEVDASPLGDEWKGYVLRITGGNDKQGFPMKQGVLTNQRVRLLLSKGHSCYRPRRDGERRRKSVRGCIVDQNLSVISVIIVKRGEQELPGLTDTTVPRRLGPKRASKIRKLFNLSKEDDVRKYVIRRPVGTPKEGKKQRERAPKIQRLITPQVLQRKRHRLALKRQRAQRRRDQAAEYRLLVAMRNKERKMKRRRSTSKRISISLPKGVDVATKAKKAKPAPTSSSSAAKGVKVETKKKPEAPTTSAKGVKKPAATPKKADVQTKAQSKPGAKSSAKPAASAPKAAASAAKAAEKAPAAKATKSATKAVEKPKTAKPAPEAKATKAAAKAKAAKPTEKAKGAKGKK